MASPPKASLKIPVTFIVVYSFRNHPRDLAPLQRMGRRPRSIVSYGVRFAGVASCFLGNRHYNPQRDSPQNNLQREKKIIGPPQLTRLGIRVSDGTRMIRTFFVRYQREIAAALALTLLLS